MTKKKYKIGTCFGCQKCLYCGIDLIKETCKCKKTLDFIKNKNECFQYGYNLTEIIQLSFCLTCNSSYQRLVSKNTQNSKYTENNDSKKITEITVVSDSASNTISKHDGFSESKSEGDDELEINYKLLIKKADGTLLPAKNQSVTISELDEFLLAIQNNITSLLEDDEIYANDYGVSFRSEKGQGAGTLLIDTRNFKNFRSEYTKLVAAKRTMAIFITMKKKENEKPVKRKKKDFTLEDEENCDESLILKTGNSNKIPKVHCLKDREPHVEISNMMFSTWATEMLNGLATLKEPPTHPSFAYSSRNRSQPRHTLSQVSNDLQNPMRMANPFFSNFFQALFTPHLPQLQSSPLTSYNSMTPQLSSTQPSMIEFLQQIDEVEKTEDYYFKFLEGFEKQRIKVKHLHKLSDKQFEACGITTIGNIETIRDAAKKYT
ncbi:hypothetical protein RhiirA1_470491 [Rhizophagus irregularis]|uniref:SAM domain-containing protein n=1 Tax=Rhizophagus irregularis TaxID=588596 RepID=A0A2N0QZU4_9GLOM|nr:hypothetical protein RhiirA1_473791 [Rhizophagus irregularis]PKC58759.1 hypothetical protein RhiirA1_470491 [Rhizophagus irregularis]